MHTTVDPQPQPVLVRIRRGDFAESQHRGAWILTDAAGARLDGAGDPAGPFFARSAIKSLQALPLIETGASERWSYGADELALALSSHNGEPMHTQRVAALLSRLGLGVEALQCGSQKPGDPDTASELVRTGQAPCALHNNCSGKHAGFLALSTHLGADAGDYLHPHGQVQSCVRETLAEMIDVNASELTYAVDGCSAPTYRLSLNQLATAFARVTSPGGLEAKRRGAARAMTAAAAAHPLLIAGTHKRLCSEISRVTGGRLFPKVGAEGVYAVGEVGADRALAVKIDDGGFRGLYPLVVTLLERLGMLSSAEATELQHWHRSPLRNWAGREVGAYEVL